MQGILFTVAFQLMCSCLNQQQENNTEKNSVAFVPAPNVIVYQLNGNWQHLVPVTLSEDKSKIVAYPGPTDVQKMKAPLALKYGWWLDTRGISANTAFLSITIEEYKKKSAAPSLEEMMKKIVVLKPFKRIMNCGNFPVNDEYIQMLNEHLRKKKIKKCTCVK